MLFWKLLVNYDIQGPFFLQLLLCMPLSKPSVTPLATRWRSRFIARNWAQLSSVQSLSPVCLWPHGLQHARLPCPSSTPELTQIHVHWVGDAIQPFHPLSSPSPAFNHSQHQGLFQMSQFFASGGPSTGASASVLPVNIQDCFPLGLTDLIFLQFKGLSRVFFNTTVQKNQFFGTQSYGSTLTSIHDYWENHRFD